MQCMYAALEAESRHGQWDIRNCWCSIIIKCFMVSSKTQYLYRTDIDMFGKLVTPTPMRRH